MAKKIFDPTVRVLFATSNCVCLAICSSAYQKMSSNRWDARVIGYDFDDIRTNVFLSTAAEDIVRVISDISDLEDSDESVRNNRASDLAEETYKLIDALGGDANDLTRFRAEIISSRNEVIKQKQEA